MLMTHLSLHLPHLTLSLHSALLLLSVGGTSDCATRDATHLSDVVVMKQQVLLPL